MSSPSPSPSPSPHLRFRGGSRVGSSSVSFATEEAEALFPVADGYVPGSTVSKTLARFFVPFRPLAEKATTGYNRRERAYRRMDRNGNGVCSFSECEAFVRDSLRSEYGNEEGESIFNFFRPAYVRAFDRARVLGQIMTDDGGVKAATPVPGTRGATHNDFVQFSEFRLFSAYLCIYAAMYDAFFIVDQDHNDRIRLTDMMRGLDGEEGGNQIVSAIQHHGFIALEELDDKNPQTITQFFDFLDHDKTGFAIFGDWCDALRRRELENDTPLSHILDPRAKPAPKSPTPPTPAPSSSKRFTRGLNRTRQRRTARTPLLVDKAYSVGSSSSDPLWAFVRTFAPFAEKTPDARKLRRAAFNSARSKYDGSCTFSEIQSFIRSTLLHPTGGENQHYANDYLFNLFRPTYRKSFDAARTINGTAAPASTIALKNNNHGDDDDALIMFSEFRLFHLYLCLYAGMYDAYLMVLHENHPSSSSHQDDNDDLSKQPTSLQEMAWICRYELIKDHGFVGLSTISDDEEAKNVYDRMKHVSTNTNSSGSYDDEDAPDGVSPEQWIEFLKRAELQSTSELGKALNAAAEPKVAASPSPSKPKTTTTTPSKRTTPLSKRILGDSKLTPPRSPTVESDDSSWSSVGLRIPSDLSPRRPIISKVVPTGGARGQSPRHPKNNSSPAPLSAEKDRWMSANRDLERKWREALSERDAALARATELQTAADHQTAQTLKLQKDLEDMTAQRTEAESDKASLQENGMKLEERVQALIKERDEILNELECATKDLEEEQATRTAVENSKEALSIQLKAAQDRCSELQSQLNDTSSDQTKEENDLMQQIKALKERIALLEAKLATMSKETNQRITELLEAKERAEQRLKDVEQEKQNLSKAQKELNQRLDELIQIRDSLTAELERKTTELDSLRRDMEQAESNLEAKLAECKDLERQRATMADQISELEKRIQSLESDNQSLALDATKTSDNYASAQETISSLRVANEEYAANLKKHEEESTQLRSELDRAKLEREKVDTTMDLLRSERDAIQSKLESANAVNEQHIRHLTTNQEETGDVLTKVKNERDSLMADKAQWDQAKSTLENELKRAAQTRDEATTNNEAMSTELDHAKKQIKHLEEEKQKYLAKIDELSERRIALSAKVEELVGRIEVLVGEKGDLIEKLGAMTTERDAVKLSLTEMTNEKQRYSLDLEQTQVKVNLLEERISKVTVEKEDVLVKINSLTVEKQHAEASLANVTAAQTEAKVTHRSLFEEKDAISRELSAQRIETMSLEAANQSLERGKRDIEEKLKQAELDRDEALSKTNALSTSLEETKSELGKVHTEKVNLLTRLEVVETKHKTLLLREDKSFSPTPGAQESEVSLARDRSALEAGVVASDANGNHFQGGSGNGYIVGDEEDDPSLSDSLNPQKQKNELRGLQLDDFDNNELRSANGTKSSSRGLIVQAADGSDLDVAEHEGMTRQRRRSVGRLQQLQRARELVDEARAFGVLSTYFLVNNFQPRYLTNQGGGGWLILEAAGVTSFCFLSAVPPIVFNQEETNYEDDDDEDDDNIFMELRLAENYKKEHGGWAGVCYRLIFSRKLALLVVYIMAWMYVCHGTHFLVETYGFGSPQNAQSKVNIEPSSSTDLALLVLQGKTEFCLPSEFETSRAIGEAEEIVLSAPEAILVANATDVSIRTKTRRVANKCYWPICLPKEAQAELILKSKIQTPSPCTPRKDSDFSALEAAAAADASIHDEPKKTSSRSAAFSLFDEDSSTRDDEKNNFTIEQPSSSSSSSLPPPPPQQQQFYSGSVERNMTFSENWNETEPLCLCPSIPDMDMLATRKKKNWFLLFFQKIAQLPRAVRRKIRQFVTRYNNDDDETNRGLLEILFNIWTGRRN